MPEVVSEFDFQKLINAHLNPRFRMASEWAVFYADASDEIYDTYEYISQVRREINTANNYDKAQVLYYINLLEPKLTQLMDLMYKRRFESHYYKRLWTELCGIKNEIPEIRKHCWD